MAARKEHERLSRRNFLGRTSQAAIAGGALAGALSAHSEARAEAAQLDKTCIVKRRLGRTDFQMSHIAAAWDWSEFILPEAIALGVNYIHKINWLARVPEPLKKLDREAWYCDATIDTFEEQGIIDQFEHALKTLGLEYIDAMKLHSIYKSVEDVKSKTGVFEAFDRLKKQGKVRHLANAQHGQDTPAICIACIESGNFDHLQPAMGVLAVPEQLKILEVAQKHDVGVITKKTMHAANMAKRSVEGMNAQWRKRRDEVMKKLQPAVAGDGKMGVAVIKTMLKMPGVTAVTPLTQNYEQLNDNLANGGMKLTARDREIVDAIRVACADMCVYCGECHHACPQRIPISNVMRYAAYHTLYNEPHRAKVSYARVPAAQRVSACKDCGSCEKACPAAVPVRHKLRMAHSALV